MTASRCWVCRRELTAEEDTHRQQHGCGSHCNADAELADRYEREGDHQ